MPRIHHARGLTLIELLMALSILSILFAMAVPSFARLGATLQDQSARQQLSSALAHARIAAVTRGARTVACPSRDGRQCSGERGWHHGWLVQALRTPDDPEPEILAVGMPQSDGVAILASSGRPQLRFLADGSARGSNLTLTFCHRAQGPEAASTLVISQAGRLRRGKASAQAAAECLAAAG